MKKILSVILAVLVGFSFTVPDFAYAADKDSSVEDILNGMTTEQKIAQTLMVDFRTWEGEDMTTLNSDVADAISEYQFGAVILFSQNIKTTEDTLQLTKDLQEAATKDGGLPLLISTDQEGGTVYRLGSGTAMPGNMAVTATGDTANAKKAGKVLGSELKAVGINTDLAPVLDINSNANNPVIGVRSFGDDTETVGAYGSAMLTGLQSAGIVSCAKHFPGHGDTDTDSHYGLPIVDKTLDQLKSSDLIPFQSAIDSGVDMIMTAHILFPQVDSTTIYSEKTKQEESRPATLSHKIITELLKGEMGFEGVVCTDGMNMEGIADTFDEDQAVVEALAAGADLICMPATGISSKDEFDRIDNIISAVEDALESGYLTEDRLDDAVTRILKLKEKRGILDYDASQYTLENAQATVGSKTNRATEKAIATKAVTVVKNENDTLPLRLGKSSKVLMVGTNGNENTSMIMAWNRAKKAGVVPEGAEVQYCYFTSDAYAVEGDLKEKLDWADTVIVNSKVIGTSYDSWRVGGASNITTYCKENSKASVVMSIGNPYDVQLYPNADAILAVYGYVGSTLPAEDVLSEGTTSSEAACGPNIIAGVEVALGTYGASGKLPVDIPEYNAETKSYTDNIVYKKGYGITYDAAAYPETFKLSTTKYTYNGKAKNPTVTIKDANGKVIKSSNYTVTKAKGRTEVGTYTYKVTFKKYSKLTKTLSFKVYPAKSYIKSLTAGKNKLKVKASYKPGSKGGSYYQIAYKQKGSSTWKYTTTKYSYKTIKSLKKGKYYYVKIRACKKVSGKTYYGEWSKIKLSSKIK